MSATNVRFTQCDDSNTRADEVKPPSPHPTITFKNNKIKTLKSTKNGFSAK
ncbi:hypothetical protein Q7O_003997 [Pectobacterium carotovorum subsp. carotovorum PCCS1]|nr:hypothetical protein [Pectobacterium carotovorum subsp. carotovorum PCCS1]